jgi:hypothetical protein
MSIFQGQPFVFETNLFLSLMFLINYFGFSCLLQIIPQNLVFPQTLEEAISYLSEQFCENFSLYFQKSASLLIQNINQITSQQLSHLQNSALMEIIHQMKQESDQIKAHNEKISSQISQFREENKRLLTQIQ